MLSELDRAKLLDGLERLGLTQMSHVAAHRAEEATGAGLSYLEFLARLVDEELRARHERQVMARTQLAHFPWHKTLEQFDFQAQPAVDERRIRELSTLTFIEHGENVLFLGPPGVGKTHLAVGLGIEAARRGYSVYFTGCSELLEKLAKAHETGTLDARLRFYSKPRLLIIDEIGYLPMDRRRGSLFFQLVCRRYERGAMILTSNKSYADWGEVMGDSVLAAATLDRLLHHSVTVNIRGESYRLREKRKAGLLRPTSTAAAGSANGTGTVGMMEVQAGLRPVRGKCTRLSPAVKGTLRQQAALDRRAPSGWESPEPAGEERRKR